jgi:hypothetical protein
MNKRPTITRMDRRHTGNRYFTHYFEFYSTEFNFSEVRIWCWETWGPSCELEYRWRVGTSANPRWCWMSDTVGRIRIYFASEKEASHFALRWA